jgi:phospholipase/carboxylesterase
MTSGLHHITAITRKIQANVDFYVGFLGLRLVKRTAGFEDARQLHLFYGDGAATPGSLVTFLAWEDGSLGRIGHGAPSEIAFAIAPGAIGFWLTRALQFNLKTSGPAQEFGEPVLRLTDPDGIIIKLVGVEDDAPFAWWSGGGIAEGDAIRRLHGATILSEKSQETVDFLTRNMGLSSGPQAGNIQRLMSDAGDVVDVRDATGFWTAAPGTGTIDHIAFRATDQAQVDSVHANLQADAGGEMNVHDRFYFYSLYVREPGGTLIELASDGPGFAMDEPLETLGSQLFIPQHFKADHEDLKVMLPQFGLPGEERITYRDLDFVHRIHMPDEPDGSTLVLLHGSGGSEADLLPLARKVAPSAMLIGVRGRSTEEGVARFFRRFSMMTFDQQDIAAEARAFAAFAEDLVSAYGVDPERAVFLGNSNGANMLGAVMQLHPGAIRKAVLLRPMNVLEDQPQPDLSGTQVLSISGSDDLYASYAAELENRLVAAGAEVTAKEIKAGHALAPSDQEIIADWLADLSRF